MDNRLVKDTRSALRQIQEHVFQAHLGAGAQQTSAGMVDVMTHADIPDLNYVSPRRGTAWVPASAVEQGLALLREQGHRPQVRYIEGLFPPLFAKTIGGQGLRPVQALPLLFYGNEFCPVLPEVDQPATLTLRHPPQDEANALWQRILHDADFRVLRDQLEPLPAPNMLELAAFRRDQPAGLLRLALQPDNGTAHVAALALLSRTHKRRVLKLLLVEAVAAARAHGCGLLFVAGGGSGLRRISAELGFVDFGRYVCYAAYRPDSNEGQNHAGLAQPVPALC